MEQKELPFEALVLNVEKFVGLTPWVSVRESQPPAGGWWKTRRKDQPDASPNRRFWWPGEAKFSLPVRLGQTDEEARQRGCTWATELVQDQIEWCGLAVPYMLAEAVAPTPVERRSAE